MAPWVVGPVLDAVGGFERSDGLESVLRTPAGRETRQGLDSKPGIGDH